MPLRQQHLKMHNIIVEHDYLAVNIGHAHDRGSGQCGIDFMIHLWLDRGSVYVKVGSDKQQFQTSSYA